MVHTCTTERNEVVIEATIWMNLGNTLSEQMQTKRPHIIYSIHMKCPESRKMLAWGWVGVKGEQ
jgi:hypothetical protein